jgi:hypothetical protein
MITDTTTAEEARALRWSRQRAAELLARYPDLTKTEVAEIVDFLRNGSSLDVGLLTSQLELRPQLDAFTAEHKKELQLGLGEAAAAVAGIAAFLALCWLVWEAIAPGAA